MIRVLIADDQGLVRAGFKALLDAREDIEVVGEAPDGFSARDRLGPAELAHLNPGRMGASLGVTLPGRQVSLGVNLLIPPEAVG